MLLKLQNNRGTFQSRTTWKLPHSRAIKHHNKIIIRLNKRAEVSKQHIVYLDLLLFPICLFAKSAGSLTLAITLKMADNKPTLHHLNNSQSQRILWLLEELGIEYNLVLHTRNPSSHPKAPFRSPPSLLATGPYGKAPVLITGPRDGNRYIPESSAIATYLIRTFDTEDKFGLRNGDWIRDEVLMSLISTTLSRHTNTIMMIDFGYLKTGVSNWLDGPELRNFLKQLQGELNEGPKGGWFMGERPGRADIMFEFPLSSIKHRETVDLEKEFPDLDAWLKRVYERPAWKRSLEKGFGGVYDLSIFPKRSRL